MIPPDRIQRVFISISMSPFKENRLEYKLQLTFSAHKVNPIRGFLMNSAYVITHSAGIALFVYLSALKSFFMLFHGVFLFCLLFLKREKIHERHLNEQLGCDQSICRPVAFSLY